MTDTFATDADRALVAKKSKPPRIYTWKVISGGPDFSMEHRAKAQTIQEIVKRYPDAFEIKRMKRP